MLYRIDSFFVHFKVSADILKDADLDALSEIDAGTHAVFFARFLRSTTTRQCFVCRDGRDSIQHSCNTASFLFRFQTTWFALPIH